MLIGLIALRPAFVGLALTWGTAALALHLWQHFEHLLLLGQALTQRNLFGAAVPTSILQLVLPRMELHLFYNAIVFIPMVIAVYFHLYPRPGVEQEATCSCRRWFVQAETPLEVGDDPAFRPRFIKR